MFIDRDYLDTRAHREKRRRDESELNSFIDRVLEIEHRIISAHRKLAEIIVNKDYSVTVRQRFAAGIGVTNAHPVFQPAGQF